MPKVPLRKRITRKKTHQRAGGAVDANEDSAASTSAEVCAILSSAPSSESEHMVGTAPTHKSPTTPEARSISSVSTLEVLSPNLDMMTGISESDCSNEGITSPELGFRPIERPTSRESTSFETYESDSSLSGITSPEPPSISPSAFSAPVLRPDSPRHPSFHSAPEHALSLCADEKKSLLLLVQEKLRLNLGPHWTSLLDSNGIHVLMLSRKFEKSIQRRLYFLCDGDMNLSVHCKPLPVNTYLGKVRPPKPLTSESVNYFVDRIVDATVQLQKYEICTGASFEEYKSVWSSIPDSEVDKNPYQECRYSETIRSEKCQRLVHLRQWRCHECSRLIPLLSRRHQAVSKEDVHRNTPNQALTDEQKKVKLETQRKEMDKTRKRLDKLRADMQLLLTKESVRVDEELSDDLNDVLQNADLSPEQALFLQQQWKASTAKKACGRRWHPSMIRLALSIFMRSRSAYEAARDSGMIQLPSSRTLFDYTHVQPVKEGVDINVTEALSKKVESFPHQYQQYHTLMCDEMYISKNLVYEKSTGRLVGYIHLTEAQKEMDALQSFLAGNPESSNTITLASKVLSFLVKGVASNVKEVVASYAVDTLTKEQLYCWSWEVIEKLEIAGIAVIAFVMDGSPINRSFIKMNTPVTVSPSGIVFDCINKAAPHRILYFIADVPHLLKTIRNCFYKSSETRYVKKNGKVLWRRCLQKNGQMILWKTIIRLYNEKKGRNLRQGYKLNTQNVFPNSYSCMRVKLAAQVLSQTVANLLRKESWSGTEETIVFIEKVNAFFDMLNGAHSHQGTRTKNPNLEPYRTADDPRFEKLMGFLSYLQEWKKDAEDAVANVTLNSILNTSTVDAADPMTADSVLQDEEQEGDAEQSPASMRQLSHQTLEGIQIAVHGFIGAVTFLLKEGAQWINARVFCQDPLEQFFSKQRSKCGGSTNPNLGQFLSNQRSIHVQGQLGMKRSSSKGNTESCDERMDLSYEPLPKRKSLFSV